MKTARRILLRRQAQPENVFAPFLIELLASEGLNSFETIELDAAAIPTAGVGDVIVVSRCRLTNAEVAAVQSSAAAGATVAMISPSFNLAHAFGWQLYPTLTYPGWIATSPGRPGCGTPIQTHVPVVHAEPLAAGEWQAAAETVDGNWQPAGHPAVTTQKCGRGAVVIWWFDLAKAVARIRFGNPDLADTIGNGHWRWPHALDLFVDHVDDRVSHLPQADFHSQLLAQLLSESSPLPLARLWYYPTALERSALIFQSDDDWSTPDQFELLVGALEKNGGRGAFYMMEDTQLPDARLHEWRAAGHTFGPHVNAWQHGRGETDIWFDLPREMARQTALFDARYGGHTATIQSHRAPWLGYMDAVPMHLEHGFRLLFAYLSGPQKMINKFMCGSGRPLRFCDLAGTVHDCWQQPVPTFDDQSLTERISSEPDKVFAEFGDRFDEAVAQTYTSFGMLSHPCSFATYSQPFIERCFEHVAAAGQRIWNPDRWLAFQDMRRGVQLTQRYAGNRQLIEVSGLDGPLAVLIPAGEACPVKVDDTVTEAALLTRLGGTHAVVELAGDKAAATIELPAPVA